RCCSTRCILGDLLLLLLLPLVGHRRVLAGQVAHDAGHKGGRGRGLTDTMTVPVAAWEASSLAARHQRLAVVSVPPHAPGVRAALHHRMVAEGATFVKIGPYLVGRFSIPENRNTMATMLLLRVLS